MPTELCLFLVYRFVLLLFLLIQVSQSQYHDDTQLGMYSETCL